MYAHQATDAETLRPERNFDLSSGPGAARSGRTLAADDRSHVGFRNAFAGAGKSVSRRQAVGALGSGPAEQQGSLSALFVASQEDLNRLYGIMRHAGYGVLLRDESGVVIDRRGQSSGAGEFDERSSSARSLEINTTPYTPVGPIGPGYLPAPICDAQSRLIGTLDVWPLERQQFRHADALICAILHAAARSIEERIFRESHRQEWVVAVTPQAVSRSAMLFAVDRDQRIVGADRYAREMLSNALLVSEKMELKAGISLWLLFEIDSAPFREIHRGRDLPIALVPVETDEAWPALVTPPEAVPTWQDTKHILHIRPRIDILGCVHQLAPDPKARGGLSPGALRRVREHIDANLETDIDLEILAKKAGLSRWHFARAFKQSTGLTPHCYLMSRRLAKAQKLLTETDLPLADIAIETGFCDQSHFSRRFREYLDVSPGMFRRAQR
jgi:AraC-like DNA-binding protein